MCKAGPNRKPSRKEEVVKGLVLCSLQEFGYDSVCRALGGGAKRETGTFFTGLFIWLKEWEKDELRSRHVEFFDVSKGGQRSTSRPAQDPGKIQTFPSAGR